MGEAGGARRAAGARTFVDHLAVQDREQHLCVADLLRLELHTGRTHQIRVHLAHIGHPVVGDPVYTAGGSRRISSDRSGAAALERLAPRQALHAAKLGFPHPRTGRTVEVQSKLPADMQALIACLERDRDAAAR